MPLRQVDVADVSDDAVVQLHDGSSVTRSGATLHGRSRVDVMLHVTVASADIDLVPREV